MAAPAKMANNYERVRVWSGLERVNSDSVFFDRRDETRRCGRRPGDEKRSPVVQTTRHGPFRVRHLARGEARAVLQPAGAGCSNVEPGAPQAKPASEDQRCM